MSNELLIQNGAAEEPQDVKNEGGRALVSKIARLPKAIREKLNRRLDDGQPASVILPWLNGLPAVKKVLAAWFAGAPINDQNLTVWRGSGYKQWLEQQNFMAELKMLAEDAKDINAAGKDGLMRITATVACTKLLRQLRDAGSTGADVVKIAFAISALNNVDQSHVHAKHEERRLEQKDELVELGWDKHLRNCAAIGLRLMDDWQAKEIHEAPFDNTIKIELLGRRMFGSLWRKRKLPGEDHIPGNVGDEEPDPDDGHQKTDETAAGPDKEQNGTNWTDGTDEIDNSPSPVSEQKPADAADREISPATESSPLPANPYAGRTTQEVIAEIEDNYAHEKAVRLNRRQKEIVEIPVPSPEPKPQAPKPEISPYEQALLEGKTHLEAMYAQAIPVKKPKDKPPEVSLYPRPNPLDSFSEPVRITGFEYRREPIG